MDGLLLNGLMLIKVTVLILINREVRSMTSKMSLHHKIRNFFFKKNPSIKKTRDENCY